MADCWHTLIGLISSNSDNEKEILALLSEAATSPSKSIKFIVNKPSSCYGGETLLMWAVWNLKSAVVAKLLEVGADPHYGNDMGQCAATYWCSDTILNHPDKACEIIKLLHIYPGE